MAYEDSAGLGVHNHYGPRTTGGGEGVIKTVGKSNDYAVELPSAGLDADGIPKAASGDVYVTAIDLNYVTGTVTHIAVGGVAVYDSSAAVTLPVHLPADNTGKVVVTGGTDGLVVISFDYLV